MRDGVVPRLEDALFHDELRELGVPRLERARDLHVLMA